MSIQLFILLQYQYRYSRLFMTNIQTSACVQSNSSDFLMENDEDFLSFLQLNQCLSYASKNARASIAYLCILKPRKFIIG